MDLQTDSEILKFVLRVVNILCFGALYLLCCIPLITVGAATVSLIKVMRRMRDDQPVTYSDFLQGIRRYFWKGTILWLVTLVGCGIAVGSFYAYRLFDPISWPLYLLGLGSGTLCVLMIPWLFGCAGYFETDWGHLLVIAYYLSIKHLGHTFLFMLIVYGLLIIGVLTMVAIPLLPGAIIYLQAGSFNRIFNQYDKKTMQIIEREPENERQDVYK